VVTSERELKVRELEQDRERERDLQKGDRVAEKREINELS
jgi:hypothetical protein